MTQVRLGRLMCCLTFISAALLPKAVLAQSDEKPGLDTPPIVAQLFACRSIEDDADRLACFDREVQVVVAANDSEELVIANKEQVKEARKGLFGFTLPKVGLFSGKKEEDVSSISSTITRIRRNASGRLVITLEGGARWEQTDNMRVLGKPGPGDTIEIRRAAIGSFMAKINGRRAFRAKRVD